MCAALPPRNVRAIADIRQRLLVAVLDPEEATTSGGHAMHSGRRSLERPLYVAPLPLVANNWPALDGRVEMWRGGCRSSFAVAAPFG